MSKGKLEVTYIGNPDSVEDVESGKNHSTTNSTDNPNANELEYYNRNHFDNESGRNSDSTENRINHSIQNNMNINGGSILEIVSSH